MCSSKILKWEFWPSYLLYLPVIVYLLIKGILTGRLNHVLSANPGLRFGGLVEYSKWIMLEQLPRKYLPTGHCFQVLPCYEEVEEVMCDLGMKYPVFLKPDKGERGRGVERVHTQFELRAYLQTARPALILQEDITGMEFGVMIIKDPFSKSFQISSVVIKEPLTVSGDGVSSLFDLILQGSRTRYHRALLEKLYISELKVVLPAGEERVLVDIGNHARGATFKDGRYLMCSSLTSAFAPLVNSISGFFVGRFDVKAKTPAALKAGKFTVLEVNGVNSEPAHIYDLGLFSAWAQLLRHWHRVSEISMINIRRGARPESLIKLMRAILYHYRA